MTGASAVLLRKIVRCHVTNARIEFAGIDSNFDEDECDTAATDKFDALFETQSTCPACFDSTVVGEQIREILDQFNGLIYCAGDADLASGDAGFIPPDADSLRCAARVSNLLGGLAVRAIRCHRQRVSTQLNSASFDEPGCKAIGMDNFNAGSAQLEAAGICPPCLEAGARTQLAGQLLSIMDGNNALTYCANCADDTQCAAPQTCGGGGIGNICGGP